MDGCLSNDRGVVCHSQNEQPISGRPHQINACPAAASNNGTRLNGVGTNGVVSKSRFAPRMGNTCSIWVVGDQPRSLGTDSCQRRSPKQTPHRLRPSAGPQHRSQSKATTAPPKHAWQAEGNPQETHRITETPAPLPSGHTNAVHDDRRTNSRPIQRSFSEPR